MNPFEAHAERIRPSRPVKPRRVTKNPDIEDVRAERVERDKRTLTKGYLRWRAAQTLEAQKIDERLIAFGALCRKREPDPEAILEASLAFIGADPLVRIVVSRLVERCTLRVRREEGLTFCDDPIPWSNDDPRLHTTVREMLR